MVGVFLSHSSKDKPFVRDLADALEAGGEIKVWLDEREIDYGENIRAQDRRRPRRRFRSADSFAGLGRLEVGEGRMDGRLLGTEEDSAHQARGRSLPGLPHPPAAAQ